MNFLNWIFEMGVVVGALVPFVNIVVKASESFGLAGKAQLAFALFFGASLSGFAFIALNGVPQDTLGYFFLLLQVLAGAGMPVGFYEVMKK